jgi:hypothetical protein
MQSSSPEQFYIYEHSTGPYDTYAGRYMPGYQPFSCGYYPPNILDDPGRRIREGYAAIKMRLRFPWSPSPTSGDKGLVSMPLIIPPVKNKKYDMFGSLFETLWSDARDAISLCDRLIIIGYSFPHTDDRSNKLFIDAFVRRSSPPQVVIVNPAPENIAHKFTFEFGVPARQIRVIKQYWEEASDPRILISR